MENKRVWDNNIIVAVDYDGTIAEQGKLTEEGVDMVKLLSSLPVTLVLWTCRHGSSLDEALEEISKYNLHFDYINDTEGDRYDGRKINADLYIDDKNPGGVQWDLAFECIHDLIRKGNDKYKDGGNYV